MSNQRGSNSSDSFCGSASSFFCAHVFLSAGITDSSPLPSIINTTLCFLSWWASLPVREALPSVLTCHADRRVPLLREEWTKHMLTLKAKSSLPALGGGRGLIISLCVCSYLHTQHKRSPTATRGHCTSTGDWHMLTGSRLWSILSQHAVVLVFVP